MLSALTNPHYANTRSLIVAISCAVVCGIVFGLSMPLISLRLEHMTGSGLMVGLNGAAAALSVVIMAPIIPRLMSMVPSRRLLILSLVLSALLFTLFPLLPIVWVWFIVRPVIVCFITIIFVISESWINQIVTPERRAFMLGIYGTALSGGFAIGGLLFAHLGARGDTAFYLGSFIFLAGLIPILTLNGPKAVAPDREGSSLRAMIRTTISAPAAILAGFAFGALETLIFSMLPIYGERMDFSLPFIGLMVFAVAMGGLTFQIPLGWIADKKGRRNILVWIAAVASFAPLLVWQAGSSQPLLLSLLFIQAGVASGLYTVGLSLLGERFSGGAIAAANAAFIFAYGLGSLIAPPVAGQAMDSLGPAGLLFVLAAIAGAYLIFLLTHRTRAAANS
jgi:MFS family permease